MGTARVQQNSRIAAFDPRDEAPDVDAAPSLSEGGDGLFVNDRELPQAVLTDILPHSRHRL